MVAKCRGRFGTPHYEAVKLTKIFDAKSAPSPETFKKTLLLGLPFRNFERGKLCRKEPGFVDQPCYAIGLFLPLHLARTGHKDSVE